RSPCSGPTSLRVLTLGDGPPSDFYYDGKTMEAFAPTQNLVATAPAPPTIDATLKAAYDKAAIYFPFSDVTPYQCCSAHLNSRLALVSFTVVNVKRSLSKRVTARSKGLFERFGQSGPESLWSSVSGAFRIGRPIGGGRRGETDGAS